MADNSKRTEVVLAYKTDQQSVNKAIREADRFSDSIAKGTSEAIESTRAFVKENASFLSQLREGTRTANDYYDKVNQDVGLAGDVASNAGQVAGALNAIGASFAGGALESFVIAGDVLEGLPRLKASLVGLPSVIGNVVTTLGPVGLGLTAVAGLATVAFAGLSDAIDKSRISGENYAQALIDSTAQVADARISLARGDEKAVLTQLKTVQDERLAQILQVQQLKELEAELNKTAFGDIPEFLRTGYGAFIAGTSDVATALQKVRDQLTELEGSTLSTATTQQELTQALLDYGLSTEQIEAGLLALTETTDEAKDSVNELNTVLLAQADATRTRYLEEINLLDQSQEALQERQKQINAEIEANNRAIDVLKSSGDTSEQVAEQIKKYTQANEELGKTLDFIGNTALPNATARAQAEQARADTEQTQSDIIEATKRYNDTLKSIDEDNAKELLAIEQKRTDSMLAIAKKYADDSEQALKRLNDDIINARERFTDDEVKAREQALQAEADATRAHYNSIADISTQAKRDEQDALRNLDFKGAFEARRNRNRAIEDEQKKFVRDADERKINQDRERKERLNAYAQAQADAQDAYRREMDTARQNRDRALQEARASYQKEQAEARNAQAQKLRDLQTGYAQEIALARQTSAQRLAIQAQTDAQLLAQAQALLNSISRNRPAPSGSGRNPIVIPPNTGGNRGGGGGNRNDRQININVNDSRNPRKTADVIRNMINNGNNKGSRR